MIENQTNPLTKKNMLLEAEMEQSWVDKLTSKQKQLFGIGLSIVSGVCYGLCFCPAQYCINHNTNNSDYSSNLEDYALSHFSGILLSTMSYFIIYAVYSKMYHQKPQVNAEAILPSILCGIVWAIAQIGFFTATDDQNLGTTTAFPIVSGSPQIIASIWGVFVFQEISSKKDLTILICAILVGITGIICMALSKT